MHLSELTTVLQLPVQDMIRIGEAQCLDPQSQIHKTFRLAVAKKLAAVKASLDAEKKRHKRRVYVQHTVSVEDRYQVTAMFPHWEFRFSNACIKSAASARLRYDVVTEYLFDKVNTSTGKILAWGIDLRAIVMRSRKWVHLCVPGHELRVQADFIDQDRAILAMVNASMSRGRNPGLPKEYVTEETRVHCTAPAKCNLKATAAIALFHTTDTNFRQVAMYMQQHALRLLYFAIPASKHLENCTEGYIPELDAYVNPVEDDKCMDIIYRGDGRLTQRYTHANYLELLARTEYRHGDFVYHKEMDNTFLGVHVFKVTRYRDTQDTPPEDILYRSWEDKSLRDKYMVYAPVLTPHGDMRKSGGYKMICFPVDRELVDSVHDAAMRAQGEKDLYGYISRRLNSAVSTSVVLNQVVQNNTLLAVTRFDLLAFVIFLSVFMRKYKDGKTVSTLAPKARQASDVGRKGVLGLLSSYVSTVMKENTAVVSEMLSAVRKFYYFVDSTDVLPLPSFLIEPGFVEYSEFAQSNPRFKSWNTPNGDPTYGFYSGLPGYEYANVYDFDHNRSRRNSSSSVHSDADPLLFACGMAHVSEEYSEKCVSSRVVPSSAVVYDSEVNSGLQWFSALSSLFTNIIDTYPDVEQIVEGSVIHKIPDEGFYELKDRRKPVGVHEVPIPGRQKAYSEEVDSVVNKVVNDNKRLVRMVPRLTSTEYFSPGELPRKIPGAVSTQPVADLRDALNTIFPGSLLQNTQFFESDKLYGNMDVSLRGNKLKIDLSRLSGLRPESFYLPLVRGHVQPDIKNNLPNVVHALNKRSFNTPNAAIEMDEDRVFRSAWSAACQVFYVDGADEILSSLPYVGPDEDAVREWVTKLPDSKRKKLESQVDFDVNNLDLSTNTMMLKSKLKPNLGASYATSVKAAQTIQFDATGKSTAVLSPIIGRKVEIEQSVLKPNVLILQRKSPDQVIRFVNSFDCRPDGRGPRYYIEIDYESFDKAQGQAASKMHWNKLAKFRVLPEYVEFLRVHNTMRSVSVLDAGVKAFLDTQRGSGHPDTLDGNNDVNMLALAELLVGCQKHIEFIILQGDDVIIAMRGEPIDATHWESEVARKFNLSMKMSFQKHGYVCSYDIVHLPDGHSVIVADVVKRALSFLSVSKKNESDFEEQHLGFKDSVKWVDDIRVQRYLRDTLPDRMKTYLPGTTSESIDLLCRVLSTLKNDYSAFRGMFALEATLRHY